MRFEPQLPFLYLPRDYYRVFVNNINKLYGDEAKYGTTKVCNESANICRFGKPCSQVEKKKVDFGIRIFDETRDIYFNINWKYMYISGEHFGGNSDECYIPVFSNKRQKDSETNLVYVGNLFMQSYYMVFDMSPLETNHNYIQVGIGLRNWDAYAAKQHYDYISDYYLPEPKVLDIS